MRTVAALTVLALALAGCSDGKGGDTVTDARQGADVPMLHGYVVDPTIKPLEGVVVKVVGSNATFTTDAGGFYGFDELPTDQFLVIVANLPGYEPSSKQITLAPDVPVRMNFTLEPEPIKAGRMVTEPFEGFIGCQVGTVGPTGNQTTDCNMGLEQRNRKDFSVDADLAGVVLELFWEPSTPGGNSLAMRLETLELGQLNVILGEALGPSPLRITVPQSLAERYYPEGGIMRLSVWAASDSEQNEAGIGVSIAAQQQFEAYASLFYVDPAPSGYTIDP